MTYVTGRLSWHPIAGVVTVAAIPLLAAMWLGLNRPYYENADQDIVHVYEALRLNQGLPQYYLDHTGYIPFVLLAWWFKFAHFIGLVPADRLSALPQYGPQFIADINDLVRAGRIFSSLVAFLFVAMIYSGLRRLAGSPIFALMLALLFASSTGLIQQTVLIRSEMLSALFAFAAFFLLIEAAHHQERASYLAILGISAMFSLMAKMQSIFLLAAYPALALFFGETFQRQGRPKPAPDTTMLIGLISIALMIPAVFMVGASIVHAGRSGFYQILLIAYGLTAMVAYRRLYSIPLHDWWWGLAALVMGLSAGQLMHLLYHTQGTTAALANFVEHMTAFSTPYGKSHVERLLGAAQTVLARQAFGLPWHEAILKASLLFLFAHNLLASRHKQAIRGIILLSMALAFEIFCSFRYFHQNYLIYTEGWILIAVAINGAALWTKYSKTMTAVIVAIALGQSVHVAGRDLSMHQNAKIACDVAGYMTIRDRLCQFR